MRKHKLFLCVQSVICKQLLMRRHKTQPGVILRQQFTLLFDQWWEQNHPYPQEAMNVSRQLWEHLATCPSKDNLHQERMKIYSSQLGPEIMPMNLSLHYIIFLKREQKQFYSPISGQLAGIHLDILLHQCDRKNHSIFPLVSSSMSTHSLSVFPAIHTHTHTHYEYSFHAQKVIEKKTTFKIFYS